LRRVFRKSDIRHQAVDYTMSPIPVKFPGEKLK